MSYSFAAHLVVGAAAFAAGGTNALAGGGTLITFPVLVAVGVPPVNANVTNTVALSPGYLGGALAQRRDLAGQEHRLRRTAAAAVAGGLLGAVLLVISSDAVFRALVPFLILLACAMLGFQDRLKRWLAGHRPHGADSPLVLPSVFVVAIYGGYFGAGLSIMILAVLGVLIDETMTRVNALKQWLAFLVNVTAALFFIASGKVVWTLAVVMAVTALLGGVAGGRLAGRLDPLVLRRVVLAIGVTVGVVYLVRLFV